MIRAEGLHDIFSRHRRLREMTGQGIRALGLELLAADAVASAAVTAVLAPAGLEVSSIRKVLLDRFNVVAAGGQGKLEKKIFRIGHLGYVADLDIISALAALEMTLIICGQGIELGSGVRAAQKVALTSEK
jgi:aspartate aminotransferase-like enzyme